jgi:hypothetical protein
MNLDEPSRSPVRLDLQVIADYDFPRPGLASGLFHVSAYSLPFKYRFMKS